MLESILRFFSTPVFAQEPPRLEVLGEAVDKILGIFFLLEY